MFSFPIRLKLNGQNTFSKSTSSKTSFHQYLGSFIKIQVFLLHPFLSQDIFEKVGLRMHYLNRICMCLLLLDIAMIIGLNGYCDGYITYQELIIDECPGQCPRSHGVVALDLGTHVPDWALQCCYDTKALKLPRQGSKLRFYPGSPIASSKAI